MDVGEVLLGVMLAPVAQRYLPPVFDRAEQSFKILSKEGFSKIRNWSDKKMKRNLDSVLFCTRDKIQEYISNGEKTNFPKEEVVIPCLNAAAVYGGDECLKDMFAELLAKSMLKDLQGKVLPRFVEIIKQLSADEAKIVRKLYEQYCKTGSDSFPVIDIKEMKAGNSFVYVLRNYTDIAVEAKCENYRNISAYIDNMVSLGIIVRPIGEYLTNQNLYDELERSDEIRDIIFDMRKENKGFKFENGVIYLTEYGKLFCEVCIGGGEFVYSV